MQTRFPAVALITLALAACAPAARAAAETTEPVDLNSAALDEIAALPGIPRELAEAIVEHREKVGFYATLEEVQALDGMTEKIWSSVEARVRVLPPVAGEAGADRPPEAGRPQIVAVANYFVEFKGLDLQALPPAIRGEFVETVNRELCPCGCVGDTLARCAVNDPGCPVAPARLRALYDAHRERANPAPESPKP